jgi:16S rRNA G527 N7-methylase RsmG
MLLPAFMGARIEMFDPCSLSLVDTVTSRALAPLPSLVELANEWLMLGAVGIFPQGPIGGSTD